MTCGSLVVLFVTACGAATPSAAPAPVGAGAGARAASASTSAVCCPRRGAGARTAPGVSESSSSGPQWRIAHQRRLQTGSLLADAQARYLVDMVKEKLISKGQAISRIAPEDIERLFYPVIDMKVPKGRKAAVYPGGLTPSELAVGWAAAGKRRVDQMP